MSFSKTFNWLLKKAGYKQKWHVAFVASVTGRQNSTGDGSFLVKGMMTSEIIEEIREACAKDVSDAIGGQQKIESRQINIVCLTRISF